MTQEVFNLQKEINTEAKRDIGSKQVEGRLIPDFLEGRPTSARSSRSKKQESFRSNNRPPTASDK